MSGIAGIIRFDGAPVEPGPIEAMTTAIGHRGPDGIAHWTKGSVALGHCMLRTTPESLEETQPLANEDESVVLVLDGRVDNWEELRADLLKRGCILRTRADAELVLRAYETWGRDCVAHIDGDFAFVIWDARRRTAFCARDRMGHKPFHYHWNGRVLAFASELHPILALRWVGEVPNEGMLAEFLAGEWLSRDETLWQGVLRLAPAHRMEVDPAGPRIDEYWAPDLWTTLTYRRDEDYVEHYGALLTDAVRRASRSHLPLACEVSGGLDSSAVFSVGEHLHRAGRLAAPAIDGYTLAFADDSDANELGYARAVGQFLGVPIREIAPSVMPLSWYKDSARAWREFPGFPNGQLTLGLQQSAAQTSRVLLTGEWGDAWLAGSRGYYAEELAGGNWRALYGCLNADAAAFGASRTGRALLRHGILPLLPPALQAITRKAAKRLRGSDTGEPYWLSPRMHDLLGLRREAHRTAPGRLRVPWQRSLLDMLRSPLGCQIMERADREAAHAGLEKRHPLGDVRIVQFAFSTPERLRLRGDRTKHLHVRAMEGRMAPGVLARKTKAEFSLAFHRHLDGMEDQFTRALPKAHPDWLSQAGMRRLFDAYRKNRHFGGQLWIFWGIYGSACVYAKNL